MVDFAENLHSEYWPITASSNARGATRYPGYEIYFVRLLVTVRIVPNYQDCKLHSAVCFQEVGIACRAGFNSLSFTVNLTVSHGDW